MIASEACELISGFYLEHGDELKANEFLKRAQENYEHMRKLQEQALNLSAKDRFAPHDLDEHRVRDLQEQLRKVRGLAAAYLVRKLVDGPTPALYVLAVSPDYTWRNGHSEKDIDSLFNDLSAKLDLPSPSVFIALEGKHEQLLNHICLIAGAELFATPEHGVRYLDRLRS